MKIFLFLIGVSFFAHSLPFESQQFAVTGPAAGLKKTSKRIYKKGGNVVDMAVAGALLLSVAVPYYVSLGAGGFALVDMGEGVEALDFREKAGEALHENYYQDKSSVLGGSAVGVPGFVAGLWSLHQKYGKLKWKTLFKPAIGYAKRGYRVGAEWSRITKSIKNLDYGMKFFFKKDGSPYLPGEKFRYKKLVRALKAVQRKNIKGFYAGSVAQDIVTAVRSYGGAMTLEDLKNYQVRWLKPTHTRFMGHEVYSMPPPSSGGIVLSAALNLIEKKNLKSYPSLSVNELHLLSEIMSRAFRGRSLLADSDFHKNPDLLSPSYLREAARSISLKRTKHLDPLKETTHLVVMDKEGRTVTMTLTLNLNYGSKVVTPRYGIVLNNQMDDFTTKMNQPNSFGLIQGKGNRVQPGKRPLSSMSPTLVKKDGKTIMALGGSGGSRIISGVLQVLYRSLVQDLNIDQAVQYPRIHHQFLPRKTFVEQNRFSPDVLKLLKKRKHVIEPSRHLGKVYGIRKRDNILRSAFDHRGDGIAWGF